MNIIATLAVCASLVMNSGEYQRQNCQSASENYQQTLKTLKLSDTEREAITRVTYGEAAGQGDAGLAGVVYTILNRYMSGDFGDNITKILNSPHQFEPVHRVGGWHNLPASTSEQRAKVDTILNLALGGHLPDMTKGALFFQNPKIVKHREKQGAVSKGLTHFGGSVPSVVIKDHAFYAAINKGQYKTAPKPKQTLTEKPKSFKQDVFVKHSFDVFSQQHASTVMMLNFR